MGTSFPRKPILFTSTLSGFERVPQRDGLTAVLLAALWLFSVLRVLEALSDPSFYHFAQGGSASKRQLLGKHILRLCQEAKFRKGINRTGMSLQYSTHYYERTLGIYWMNGLHPKINNH